MTDPDVIALHLARELKTDEDTRYALYDDATARPFRVGDTLKGNLTGGVGHNFMVPLDAADVEYFLAKDIAAAKAFCEQYAWYTFQDVVRQTALINLTFNLGETGLLHWPHFLACMLDKDYAGAVAQIASNQVWRAQVGHRADRIEAMIATGNWT